MEFPTYTIASNEALALEAFKTIDYYAVEHYQLPIELMMENAGLQLARLLASQYSPDHTILVGIGNGNNGGGGLVAARRLAAWGYKVFLDLSTEINKPLPAKQLQRALKFGVEPNSIKKPDVWIDAYLGFSQRLPLSDNFFSIIQKAKESQAFKISLDLPTGFLGDVTLPYFPADQVISLAAPKKILSNLASTVTIFLADLGIPKRVYQEFKVEQAPFYQDALLKLKWV